MRLYFRDLTYEDIPQILEITKDVWEGQDYIPEIINEWLNDKDSLNYGGFEDKTKANLIGFGRVKIYSDIAWLEGGRVKADLQRKGIGKALMKYAIDYAKRVGVKTAQYDTASDNYGSLALAKHFGFKEKKSMHVLECSVNELLVSDKLFSNIKHISLIEAKEIYKNLDIGPGNEICIGWSFIPIDFLSEKNSSWIQKNNAIIQTVKFKRSQIQQNSNEYELWMICYGNIIWLQDLIEFTLLNTIHTKNFESIVIFCNPIIVDYIKKLGFSYWEEETVRVLLFEKEY